MMEGGTSAERQLRNASTSELEAEEDDVLALDMRKQTRVTRRCTIVGVLAAMIDVVTVLEARSQGDVFIGNSVVFNFICGRLSSRFQIKHI
jgi:hypothetical protein